MDTIIKGGDTLPICGEIEIYPLSVIQRIIYLCIFGVQKTEVAGDALVVEKYKRSIASFFEIERNDIK